MQFYIKIFNKTTNELVGYYKQTGKNCISKILNGIKYFNTINEALEVYSLIDDGILRDKDHHYYSAFCSIYGDSSKSFSKEPKKSKLEREEELKNE